MNMESNKNLLTKKNQYSHPQQFQKVKIKNRVGYFKTVTSVRSKEPLIPGNKLSLWEVRADLLFFFHEHHQIGAIQGYTEVQHLLEYYTRCEGGSI